MGFFTRKKKQAVTEQRNLENPNNPVTMESVIKMLDEVSLSEADVNVTIDSALGVPAIWCAVVFISHTVAGLPLKLFQTEESGRKALKDALYEVVCKVPNVELSKFTWLQMMLFHVLTEGRSFSVLDRNVITGEVQNIYLLNPDHVTVYSNGFQRRYKYKPPNGEEVFINASDMIDIPFLMKKDGVNSYSPIRKHKDSIGLAIAATKYGSKFFKSGGIPPYVVSGPFATAKGADRARLDLNNLIKKNSASGEPVSVLPDKHTITSVGSDLSKNQLVDLKRFSIEEAARIYNLPPVFLQDLTHGTFANTEQQDLHLVKHTVKRWVEQIESEVNLKVFGRKSEGRFFEFNLEGLMRGDLKTRMEAFSLAVNSSIYTPAEVRQAENREFKEGSDQLFIQSGTVPVTSLDTKPKTPDEEPEEPKGRKGDEQKENEQ